MVNIEKKQHSKHPSFLSLRETLLVAPRAAPADPDAWSWAPGMVDASDFMLYRVARILGTTS